MNRTIMVSGILTCAAIAVATLLLPMRASTQTLPPSSMRLVETTYASVGVSAMGNNGSVAWFIETDTNKERFPIACVNVSGSVECKRGRFP